MCVVSQLLLLTLLACESASSANAPSLCADDSSIIAAEEAATSPFATAEQVIFYESILSHARGLHHVYPSRMRVDYLGEQLSQYASIVRLPTPEDMESSTWLTWIHKLIMHERNDFAEFSDYYAKGFQPQIFHWPTDDSITWLHNEWFYGILHHSRFDVWRPAFRNGHSYVPDKVPTFFRGQPYRTERVQKVHHMMVIYEAVGVLPSHFDQVVEFGGGTGDLVPTLREAGFTGYHFVVDLEPMLLLQQYFLRYSNWPAYLSTYLPTKQNRSTLLIPSSSSDLTRLLDQASFPTTLLIATWSLTETPTHIRDSFMASMYGVGTILFAFADDFASLNNVPWINALVRNELLTYSICVWRMPAHSGSSYLIARKKSTGNVVCSEIAGCSRKTLTFGRNCMLSVDQ